MTVQFSNEPGPRRGETVFQAQVPTESRLKSALARKIVTELISVGLVSSSEQDKFVSCMEEGLANAFQHGNRGREDLSVYARIYYDDGVWGVVIEDEGDGFSACPQSDGPDPWETEGRGIEIMAHVMDRVEYYSSGKTLVLESDVGSLQLREDDHPGKCSLFVRVLESGGGTVATCHASRATEDETNRLLTSIRDCADNCMCPPLVLDLGGVEYLNSTGIGALVGTAKRCQERAVELFVCGLNEELSKLFRSLRLDSVFQLFPSTEDAFRQAKEERVV